MEKGFLDSCSPRTLGSQWLALARNDRAVGRGTSIAKHKSFDALHSACGVIPLAQDDK
jgi:hypothetical protein